MYDDYILNKVDYLLKEQRGTIHEYYEHVDNPKKDYRVLDGLEIQVYKLDRESMPHTHLIDKDKTEIEVSLTDWGIVYVKNPQNASRSWSNFTSIRDRFFEWLKNTSSDGEVNYIRLFKKWDENNPDNQLDDYYRDKDVSNELKEYLKLTKPQVVDLNVFKKEIYKALAPLIFNPTTKNEIIKMDTISLLKYVGLDKSYSLDDKILVDYADEIICDMKKW